MKLFVTGGVKSGKSAYAENRCLEISPGLEKPLYLATTELFDDETKNRIALHRERRGDRFHTFEEPLNLADALKTDTSPELAPAALIECLTLWLNNMLHHRRSEDAIFREVDAALKIPRTMVFVMNEVGLGIIPDNPLARKFADLSGRVSARIVNGCEEAFFCVAGQPLKIK